MHLHIRVWFRWHYVHLVKWAWSCWTRPFLCKSRHDLANTSFLLERKGKGEFAESLLVTYQWQASNYCALCLLCAKETGYNLVCLQLRRKSKRHPDGTLSLPLRGPLNLVLTSFSVLHGAAQRSRPRGVLKLQLTSFRVVEPKPSPLWSSMGYDLVDRRRENKVRKQQQTHD